jgi:hypothetical protein
MTLEGMHEVHTALRLLQEAIGIAEQAQWAQAEAEKTDYIAQCVRKMRMALISLINAREVAKC